MDPLAQARIEAAVALRKALGLEQLLGRLRAGREGPVETQRPRPGRRGPIPSPQERTRAAA